MYLYLFLFTIYKVFILCIHVYFFSDVIGVCKETMDISSVVSRASGRELKKRDLQIVDDTNHEVSILYR